MKKLALITGAAMRIGSEIARYLALNNWDIVIHYNDSKSEAEKLKRQIENQTNNISVYLIQADFNNRNQLPQLIKYINDKIGMIDLLVNNAALFKNDNIYNLAINDLQQHLEINLIAPMTLIQDFVTQYQGTSGNIINILDYAVIKPPNKFLSYMVSKSSMLTATKMIAQMIAPNIRINAIGPGPTLANSKQSDINFQNACNNTLLKCGSTIEEICNTINYILDNKSITGQLFMLDSGRVISNYEYS